MKKFSDLLFGFLFIFSHVQAMEFIPEDPLTKADNKGVLALLRKVAGNTSLLTVFDKNFSVIVKHFITAANLESILQGSDHSFYMIGSAEGYLRKEVIWLKGQEQHKHSFPNIVMSATHSLAFTRDDALYTVQFDEQGDLALFRIQGRSIKSVTKLGLNYPDNLSESFNCAYLRATGNFYENSQQAMPREIYDEWPQTPGFSWQENLIPSPDGNIIYFQIQNEATSTSVDLYHLKKIFSLHPSTDNLVYIHGINYENKNCITTIKNNQCINAHVDSDGPINTILGNLAYGRLILIQNESFAKFLMAHGKMIFAQNGINLDALKVLCHTIKNIPLNFFRQEDGKALYYFFVAEMGDIRENQLAQDELISLSENLINEILSMKGYVTALLFETWWLEETILLGDEEMAKKPKLDVGSLEATNTAKALLETIIANTDSGFAFPFKQLLEKVKIALASVEKENVATNNK